MDSITQAVLGAAIGEAVAGKRIGNKAAIAGAIIASIPDLDVVIMPLFDPLQRISVHRGFSHSIVFCILGAFLFAYILNRIKWTKELSYRSLWLFSFLALFTHVLLDAFTTFGTQLLLPFTDWRVSFDSVNIIDPVYTVPLLIGVLVSVFNYKKGAKKRSFPNTIGLVISSLYLIFTLANKQHVENKIYAQLEEKNIPSFNMLTVPVGIGNMNWYGVARDNNFLHLGKYSVIEDNKIEFHSFPINNNLLEGLDSELVDRMKWFSQGYYTVAEHEGKIRVYNMQCDMQGVRYFGKYKAPTAFYYEITPHAEGTFELSSGMHMANE